ncbi:MFS transporter [Amycolatopsis ultiminotia]|uniref:MFS transporter n=1 Tax=Amycolatopsis ultiminotia TaxID=543629 RepID=A0ABP6XHI0_9PSEU
MRRLFPLTFGMFVIGLDAFVLSGLLPGMAQSLGTSVASVGQVATAFTFAYAIGSPLMAVATAGMDRRKVALFALAVFGLANAVSALAPALWVLILIRIVAGVFGGLFSPAAVSSAVSIVGPQKMGRAISTVMAGLALSTVAGVPVGVLVGAHFGWRATMWMIAALTLVALVAVAAGVPTVSAPPPPGLKARVGVLFDARVSGRIGIMLLFGIAQMGLVYTYLAVILAHSGHVSTGLLPVYLLVAGIASFAGNTLVGRLLDRGITPPRLLGFALGGLAVVLAAIPVAATNPVGIVVVLLLWGLAVGNVQVPLQFQLAAAVPQHASIVVSLLNSALYLGTAVGAAVGGVVLASAGPGPLGPIAAAVVVVAFVLNVVFAVRAAKKPQAAKGEEGAAEASVS